MQTAVPLITFLTPLTCMLFSYLWTHFLSRPLRSMTITCRNSQWRTTISQSLSYSLCSQLCLCLLKRRTTRRTSSCASEIPLTITFLLTPVLESQDIQRAAYIHLAATRAMDFEIMDPTKTPSGPPPPGVTPNFVNPPSNAHVSLIVTTIMIPLLLAFISLRIYSNLWVERKFAKSDCEPISSSNSTCIIAHCYTQMLAFSPR